MRYRPGALAVVGSNPTGPTSLCKSKLQINYNDSANLIALGEEQNQSFCSYAMFEYSIRSELTRKYYERLGKFFDFIQFETELKEIEKRCNAFAEKGRSNTNWTLNQIIRFLHFQKERDEKEEITAATLKNFIQSLKVFCESAGIDVPWKKVTRGLPKGRQAANDRAPTIGRCYCNTPT